MFDEYLDKPNTYEADLEVMTDIERAAFDKGYLVAVLGMLEQLSESKQRMLTQMLGLEDAAHKKQLQSRVYILDIYEKHYTTRARSLSGSVSQPRLSQ